MTTQDKVTKMARFRKERGLSCQAIADAISTRDFKVDASTIYRIERGEQQPKQETARRLFRFYREQNARIPLSAIYDPLFVSRDRVEA